MTVWDLIFTLQTAIDAGVITRDAIYTDWLIPSLEEKQKRINWVNSVIRDPRYQRIEEISIWPMWAELLISFYDWDKLIGTLQRSTATFYPNWQDRILLI